MSNLIIPPIVNFTADNKNNETQTRKAFNDLTQNINTSISSIDTSISSIYFRAYKDSFTSGTSGDALKLDAGKSIGDGSYYNGVYTFPESGIYSITVSAARSSGGGSALLIGGAIQTYLFTFYTTYTASGCLNWTYDAGDELYLYISGSSIPLTFVRLTIARIIGL